MFKIDGQALKVRKATNREAKLSDFMELLQQEVDLVSDPLYSREANHKQAGGQDKERDTQRDREKSLELKHQRRIHYARSSMISMNV